MRLLKEGIQLIHAAEGCELTAYPDPASALGQACIAKRLKMSSYRKVEGWESLDPSPVTIGWGHTGKNLQGQPLALGMSCTQSEADQMFENDCSEFHRQLKHLLKDISLNDAQYSAIFSISYNMGVGGFSTTEIFLHLKAGDLQKAADAFPLYNKAKNKKTGQKEVLSGLVKRREKERELFLSGMFVRKIA